MKRRIVSIITALALCLSLCPTWAFAAGDKPDTGLCPHHIEHIDCGYIAPAEGQSCDHEHTAECYTLGVLPDADGSEYYEIGPDTQNMLDCQHSHDESCGYVQADPGQPCGFECRVCPIEDLIAVLPDEVTADNVDNVRARLDDILALYAELTEEEQEQIDLSRCMELQEALDAAPAPAAEEDPDGWIAWENGFRWRKVGPDSDITLQIEGTGPMPNTQMNQAPWGNSLKIHYVEISEGVTSIGNYAFYRCGGIKSVTFPSSSLTSIGEYAFYHCTGLNIASLPDSVERIGRSAFNNCGNLGLTSLPANLISVGDSAFYGCINLRLTSLPARLASVGGSAFAVCTSLKSINLTSDTTFGTGAFSACIGLESLMVTGNVTSIGINAFNSCTNLKSVTITGNVGEIGISAFCACENLNSVTVEGKVGTIGNTAFKECASLTEIRFQNEVNATAPTLGKNAFQDANEALRILVPAGAVGYTAANGWPEERVYETAAKVTRNGQTTYAITLAEAFDAKNSGAAVTLLGDVTLTEALTISNQFTLDLNGHTIFGDVTAGESSALTIQDRKTGGTITSVHIVGAATLEGGTYGSISISSKTFADLLPEDHAYYIDGQPLILNDLSGQTELTGPVTVGECGHEGMKPRPAESDPGKHVVNCPYCGYSEAAENCNYDFSGNVGTCQKCQSALTVTVTGTDGLTFDGTEKTLTISVTVDGQTLDASNYNVSYSENTNAGNQASVTVSGTGWSYTENFSIAPAALTADMVELAAASVPYNGKEQTPAVVVKWGQTTLVKDTDYTVSYSGNTNVGTGTVTVTGKGNYTGTVTKNFEITKANVTITWGSPAQSVTYTGSAAAITAPTVSADGGLPVSATPEYSYAEKDSADFKTGLPTNAGIYTVRASIAESDNLSAASADMELTIAPLEITVTPNSGQHKEYGAADPKLTYTTSPSLIGSDTLTGALAYTGTDVGTYPITLGTLAAPSGNYTLKFTSGVMFEITKPSLENATVTLSESSFTYDGTAKVPTVTVEKNGSTVNADQYDITYSNTNGGSGNHTNAGTVTVTVTAKADGNYSGSKSGAAFTILPKPVTAAVTAESKTYDGDTEATVKAEVNSGNLVSGDSITITGVTGTFADANVGTDKTVHINSSAASVTGTGAENYKISYPATVTADITPVEVKLAFSNQEITYGDTPAPATADPAAAQISYSYTGTASGNGWPTNAGTYTVTAKVAATGNYGEATATATLTINKAPLSITGAAVAPKTYDTTTTATVTGVTFSGLVNGETLTAADYTATGEFADANAGENKSVTVTVALSNTTKANNYTLSSGTSKTTGTIKKADSSITTPPTATGITYGQALSASTLSGGAASVAGAWAWTDGTTKPNAGTAQHEVTFTPTDTNYSTATVNVSVAVARATPTITWGNSSQTVNYTGEAAKITAPTVTLANGESFSGTISYSYSSNDSDYASGLPTNAGTYKVKASIGEQSNYFAATSAEMTLTISQVDYNGTKTAGTSGRYGMTKTYDLKDLLPEGYVLGTVTASNDNGIFEGTPSVNGTVLTYKLANVESNAGKSGTITVPVTSSTNYKAFDLTITVTVTNVRVPDLSANPIRVTYTGSPVPDSSISGTATVDGKEIKGRWSFASGQALTNVADSGTKNVTFTPEDTTEYGPNTGTVVVTITKATPSLTLTPSPATLPNGGTVTLTLSGLPAGGSADVTCSNGSISVTKGSGNTWTADLPAGGGSYAFTASYPGDGNHTGATANCTVSVEKVTPTLALSATPENLSGGGTVTLTLTGLPAGGTATVRCSDSGITVTAGAGNTWTATLPNRTATYTFTVSYAGNSSYHPASASRIVTVQEVIILPDPPAGDGDTHYQVVMKPGISEIPEGLKNIPELNTPEKLELAMKLAITQLNTGISQANTAVYDVTLMVSKDGGITWEKATADNFPSDGLRVTLPYPSGTDSSYQFTVVHMFTTTDFGKTPGQTEAPKVSNTSKGIQFVVTGLSPISVGWTKASTPTNPTGPTDGGGSYVSTYAVTVEKSEHGKVTSNRNNAASGTTVTLTVTPDSGYVLDTLTVTDSRGNEIKLTAQNNGKYTFTMPSRAVTVKATFVPLPDGGDKPCDGGADCPSRGFTDLGPVGTWYHEAVDYVLCNGLMGGYSSTMFGPNDNLTRAQFAQILFNKEGRPVVNYLLQYSDVAAGAWYTEAIRWATSQGIVGGYGNGKFGPNDNITREQLAVMLWRYAGSPAATNKELHFADVDKISNYALEALRWAVENGIINGYGDGRLGPDGLATRAQVAQMLKNYIESQEDDA